MAYVMAGLFELHDRSRFELIAISLQPEDKSPMGMRVRSAFDQFIVVHDKSDLEVATLMRSLEIDIAVDLMGFTQFSSTAIFAHRPAPVQVNYMGYPGTMGADYIDYILADSYVIPPTQQACYSEQVVYLPDSYFVFDHQQKLAVDVPGRSEMGLPDTGFVFCCFNNNYKITPEVFDIWMRLLEKVKGSVLWLRESNPAASVNLRHEAELRGVDTARIIFAPRLPVAVHLARHQLADLFLDTLPYNAHTTAADALWAGLPVLTRSGESFASRVAGSLLQAVGLPELITDTPEAYEALALELATNQDKLDDIKARLKQNRNTCPLFNTDRFRRHIEAAYIHMWQQCQQGLAPKTFTVNNN
jgi:predicted O-linked N-acetylglucosamine transferase (SPINDLY family)